MRALALISMAVALVACTSVSNVSYPVGNGQFHNQRTITDPHAFAPTHTRSWLEVCEAKADKEAGEAVADYSKCHGQYEMRYATSTGYLDGLGAAALYSGAIVGGSALIGNGIAQSGTTVNQSGGGAAQSQQQQQGQGQLQGQHQRR